jgi:hypothetical protein
MKNLFDALKRSRHSASAGESEDRRWVCALPGIVAENEDPENQHRIKVVIPSIDEDRVCDEWVKQLVLYVGPPGYGSFFVPEKGVEVALFGELGEKHTLFYLPVFNEDRVTPSDFDTPAKVGFRVPGDFKVIAEGDMQLRAGGIQIEADGAIHIVVPGGLFINGRPV